MARQKGDPRQQADATATKPPVRVMRRRRRGPAGGRQRTETGGPPERAPQNEERAAGYGPPPPAASMRIGRAPRPAEPPPKNPNVFSYTYTIWKSS